MTRVLVTGATGFLGRRVLHQLHGRAELTALARGGELDGIEMLNGDLADADSAARLLTPWRWDAVVNLAGPVTSGNEDLRTGIDVITAHTRIALNLRRHAYGARVVHASSMTVYGLPDRVDVEEEHARRPRHLYGLAKLLAEDVLLADPALDAWVLRLPGLFSEQRRSGALFHFCRAARTGEPLRITTAEPTAWNTLHVDDAAAAIVRTLDASERAGGALNISYGEPVELVAVASSIAHLAGKGSTVEHPGVVHPPFHLVTEKAKRLIGWQPPTLRERLAKLYEDYAAA